METREENGKETPGGDRSGDKQNTDKQRQRQKVKDRQKDGDKTETEERGDRTINRVKEERHEKETNRHTKGHYMRRQTEQESQATG